MKAIVLCAGFGTRLYPLTGNRAKPLLPVAENPIVEHLVEALRGHVDDSMLVVVNARFYDDFVAWSKGRHEILNDGAQTNETRRGAVPDLQFAVRETNFRGPVLVAAGDNLFRISFDALFEDYHARPRNLILRYRESDPEKLRRTGVAELGDGDRLVKLWEKPPEPPTEWACPALYILEPDALALLDTYVAKHPAADALGTFIGWLARKIPVYTHEMQGDRLDVGDRESYEGAATWLRVHSR